MNDIILLFDNYSMDSQNLHTSFKLAGYECPAAVIEDDGFLPDEVMSVYGFFLGDFRAVLGENARPRYFNEIVVPDYWEISGNNTVGKVCDLYRERGKIFYAEPKHKRLVRIVDWYDERGVVRSSDHYNRYGALYARTIFNAKGQKVNKSYFSPEGREVIVENYVTGDIILNEEAGIKIFRSKTEFVLYFFVKSGVKQSRIFFNSLSTPFFVSNRLSARAKRDVLFWQEPIGTEIPGNMQSIFNGEAGRTAQVMVQKRQSYEKLLALGAPADKVHKLGYIYSFEKENRHRAEALICTNSDRIERCEEIVTALPKMHFHIAAITEMSSKLLSVGVYDNVSLYPGIKMDILDELFEKCDYYLDINHESEIVSAVYKAFLNDQLIFAFEETVHNRTYVAQEHIFQSKQAERLITDIQNAMADDSVMERYLQKQHEAAFVETEESYRKFFV